MQTRVLLVLLLSGLLTACTSNNIAHTQVPTPYSTETPVPTLAPATATPEATASVLGESEPSYKVAAFYYPWYGNPQIDRQWIHWTQNNHLPPDDIAADYYPVLGPYSSNDPAVVAQHMEWLRQAGVGVIISSWWGQGSREDQTVPLLLQTAERYGIKVAFHIEPYNGRTAETLISDIQYLYQNYGSSPAFFRSTKTSRYSPGDQPKGMFFVWSVGVQGAQQNSVEANYWQAAMDSIHALPEGALVIANTRKADWIDGGHFDGLYNYATLHLEESGGFEWARSLPPDALYVPSVIPGFSARRVGYEERTFVSREEGATYSAQWTAALNTGVEPALVTITSFNEWHEGSVIEPAQAGVNNGNGYAYADFGALPPEGYLNLTREWINKYLAMTWSTTQRARIKIMTTSDWTTLAVMSGGTWLQPEQVQASPLSLKAGMEAGDRFVLTQSLENANAGNQVEMTWDILLTDLVSGQDLVLQIERGHLGRTQVVIYNYTGSEPVEVKAIEWSQVTTGRNSHRITIPADQLIASSL